LTRAKGEAFVSNPPAQDDSGARDKLIDWTLSELKEQGWTGRRLRRKPEDVADPGERKLFASVGALKPLQQHDRQLRRPNLRWRWPT